jgi:hypothetical protein
VGTEISAVKNSFLKEKNDDNIKTEEIFFRFFFLKEYDRLMPDIYVQATIYHLEKLKTRTINICLYELFYLSVSVSVSVLVSVSVSVCCIFR